MHARRILGCLLLAVASLLAFSQIGALFTMPEHPMLPNFRHEWLVTSSIENFGFAIPAIVIGFFLLRGRARFWLWFALIVASTGLWLFVIRQLWLHYYEMPRRYPHLAEVHRPYFTGPLWWVLVRVSEHIMLPVSFILACLLAFRREPNNALEPTATAPSVSTGK